MTLHTYPDVEQRSPEWDDLRRGIVTASVVGRLVGVQSLTAIDFDCPACGEDAGEPCRSKRAPQAPIKTMHPERVAVAAESSATIVKVADNPDSRALVWQLAAERITGWTEPTYVSDDMWRGVEDEPRAVEHYSKHYAPIERRGHNPVERGGFMVLETPEGHRIGYSPDGTVGDDGLFEAKSRKPKKHLQTILSNTVPPENMAQLQCGLLVSGRDWIDYASYCGGMPMWVIRVTPDPRWFDAILAAVDAYEQAAGRMAREYRRAVNGLPATERTFDDSLELKL